MKKFLAIFLCLVLAIGMCTMMGCGDNYTQLTEAEATELYANIDESEKGNSIDYAEGYSLDFEMEMKFGDESTKVHIKMDFVTQEEEVEGEMVENIVVSGSLEMDNNADASENMNVDLYYDGEYVYANGTVAGETEKVKMAMDYDSFMRSYVSGQMQGSTDDVIDINSLLDMFEDFSDYKIYRDATNPDEIKIKIVIPNFGAEDYMIDGEVYYTFDSTYKLISCKTSITSSAELMGVKMEMPIEMEIKPFAGSIDAPSDLDTYEEIFE